MNQLTVVQANLWRRPASARGVICESIESPHGDHVDRAAAARAIATANRMITFTSNELVCDCARGAVIAAIPASSPGARRTAPSRHSAPCSAAVAEASVERCVAEAEDAAVGGGEPVAVAGRGGGHADDGLVEVVAPVEP